MDFSEFINRQRGYFQSGATRSVAFRRLQLQKLAEALQRREKDLLAGLEKDLGKSAYQGYVTELALVHSELQYARKNLAAWSRPTRAKTPWLTAPSRAWVQMEPLGLSLILGPWNYPAQLLLIPLVSAIAAGNCVVLKPSELASHTATAITQMIRETFPESFVAAIEGGVETAEALLREKFDKIFFTGGARVGRLVMTAAARHLTPVTLELGGKCPAMIFADADIDLAAKRVAWGKFMNAGQTCVAPDFALVERGVCQQFASAMKKAVEAFYGEDASKSADYGRIINAGHFQRLTNYLRDGKMLWGGNHEANSLFIEPTALTDVGLESPVMQEEIFGPILPILPFDRIEDVVALMRGLPTPLALYVFTSNRQTERRVLLETRSGGACVNDVVTHMVGRELPFGGLGESGFGAYHGRAGLAAFSHARSILRRATWLDLPFLYAPQKLSLAKVKRAMRVLLSG